MSQANSKDSWIPAHLSFFRLLFCKGRIEGFIFYLSDFNSIITVSCEGDWRLNVVGTKELKCLQNLAKETHAVFIYFLILSEATTAGKQEIVGIQK